MTPGPARRPAPHARVRPAAALAAAWLVPALALAQSAPRSDLRRADLLVAEGPRTTGVPVQQPFFPAWTADLTGRWAPPPAARPRPGEPAVSQPVPDASLRLETPLQLGGPAVDPATGFVYVGTADGRLHCFEQGRLKWAVSAGSRIDAPPAVFEESVLVGTGAGVLLVFNKVTGELRLRAILGEELVTQPVVAAGPDGKPRAYVGSGAESLFAVDLELGRKLWRAHRDPPSGFQVHGFARPVVAGDAVYAAYGDGYVVALDPQTGIARWEKRVSPPGEMIDVDGLAFNGQALFAASYTGGVYALEPASGATLWHEPLQGAAKLRADGPWLYAVAPGQLRALRAGDGKAVWSFRIPEQRSGTTPLVTPELVVVAASGGPLYFVDRRTGAPEGILGVGEGFSSQPALFGRVLYALSNQGRLYSAGLLR